MDTTTYPVLLRTACLPAQPSADTTSNSTTHLNILERLVALLLQRGLVPLRPVLASAADVRDHLLAWSRETRRKCRAAADTHNCNDITHTDTASFTSVFLMLSGTNLHAPALEPRRPDRGVVPGQQGYLEADVTQRAPRKLTWRTCT